MNEERKTFLVYFEWYENTIQFDNAQFGELFRAIFEYVETGKEHNFNDGSLNMAFKFIKNDLDRNILKYLEVKKKRAEAGSKGGKVTQAKFKQNSSKIKQIKHYDNDNDNDNDNVNDNGGYRGETIEEEVKRLMKLRHDEQQ